LKTPKNATQFCCDGKRVHGVTAVSRTWT